MAAADHVAGAGVNAHFLVAGAGRLDVELVDVDTVLVFELRRSHTLIIRYPRQCDCARTRECDTAALRMQVTAEADRQPECQGRWKSCLHGVLLCTITTAPQSD